jgi:hypothetical protein
MSEMRRDKNNNVVFFAHTLAKKPKLQKKKPVSSKPNIYQKCGGCRKTKRGLK